MGGAASASLLILVLLLTLSKAKATATACRDRCGSTQVKYPLGTGYGCGSPLLSPYIRCSGEQLYLKTHTGSYPISSISYSTSTLTLTPPSMSTCTSMHPSPNNFGLDLTSPFQIASTTFLLLSCQPALILSSPICDPSFDYLCSSLYTCPSLLTLGLPLFSPTNTCCVYSPANLDANGELDLKTFNCAAYASVVSLGDNPTDPTHWLYGVSFKYSFAGLFDNNYATTKCSSCETSGGVCGFAPPNNAFLCLCNGGYNTTFDCSNFYNQNHDYFWDSTSSANPTLFTAWRVWRSILAGFVLSLV